MLPTDVDAVERAALHQRLMAPLALSSAGYVVAYAMSLFAVETVMGSGPVLSALGLWLVVRGLRAQNPAATLLGLGHGVLSLTLFLTVNALDWSPNDARQPFAVIGAIGGGLTVVLALLALAEPRQPAKLEALSTLRHTAPDARSG